MVYVTGGSEAVESCLKIALQYQTAIGQKSRRLFISRQRSWHGNTLGALGAVGLCRTDRWPMRARSSRRSRSRPPTSTVRSPGATAETAGEACAAELEAAILQAGPETVAAFVFEPVVGAAGGCVPAPPAMPHRVRDICTRYGVLMIADEVMCGAGRTGTWRALEPDGVEPDIMSVAKGLAGGYMPLGAAICTTNVWEAIRAKDGAFGTGHTFTGHTAACAAGRRRAADRGARRAACTGAANETRLKSWLDDALAGLEAVGDIRGRGPFHLRSNWWPTASTKAPFDPSASCS